MNRRLLRVLVLLYPRDWRKRYGDELAALCQELLESDKTTRLRLVLGLGTSACAERARCALAAGRRTTLTKLAAGAIAATATAMVLVGTPAVGRLAQASAASLCTGPAVPGTSLATVEEAYWCIFAHYYSGPVLDGQSLLVGAFGGFTDELDQAGLGTRAAELPALRGDRMQDWESFASAYQAAEAQLGAGPTLRQELASATLGAMVGSLHDDHAAWEPPPPPEAPVPYGLRSRVRASITRQILEFHPIPVRIVT